MMMNPHFESTNSEFETTRSARLRPMRQRPSWGHVVHNSDPGVPDLLSDDVDEETERFMMRPTTRKTFPLYSSRHEKKRQLHMHDEQQQHWSYSPTTRRRTQDIDESCCGGDDIQDEVVKWVCDNMGWNERKPSAVRSNKTRSSRNIKDQEEMVQQWNEHHHHGNTTVPPPPPVPLERQQNRIRRNKVHPAMLQREALLDADENKRRPAANAKPARIDTSSARMEASREKHVNMYGKDHVYASLENGSAAMFQCVACDKRMLASRGMKLSCCTECGTLRPPTEIEGEINESDLY